MNLVSLGVVFAACSRPAPPSAASSEPSSGGATADTATPASVHSETADTGSGGTVAPPELTWVEADNGFEWSCGLVSDGTVRCWGADYCTDHAPARDETFAQISVEGYAGCGVRLDGTIECWCCTPTAWSDDGASEICDQPPTGVFERVEAGPAGRACAQARDGVLTCWGVDGFKGWNQQPHDAVGDFALEDNTDVAVLADGSVLGWGTGDTWLEDPPSGVVFSKIADGRSHACGLDVDGVAHCWGHTAAPDYVNGGYVAFPDPPPGVFAQITGFNQVTCVIDAGGTPSCWGVDPGYWIVPMPTGTPFAQIGLGEGNACGVTLSGEALCWGSADGAWLYPPALRP